jgi:hypothetical protein
LEKAFRVISRNHRLKKFPLAMPASKGTVFSSHADGHKSVLLRGEVGMIIWDRTGDGKGKFITEMDFTNPEGFGIVN